MVNSSGSKGGAGGGGGYFRIMMNKCLKIGLCSGFWKLENRPLVVHVPHICIPDMWESFLGGQISDKVGK